MADKSFMSPGDATSGPSSVLANIRQLTSNGPGSANSTIPFPASSAANAVSSAAGAGRGSAASYIDYAKNKYNYQIGGGRGTVNPSIPHESNNVVATTEPDPVINLKFAPNILDNYDTYSYHIKLFMTTEEASSAGLVLDPMVQTIIAETGVTDLTIDNLEIRSVATPSIETGTGTGTTMSFDILEPSGAGLIDKIYYQSMALGIGNWSVSPFYLQVSFRTRDPESSASLDDPTGSLNNLSWLYPIKMGEIKAHVTNVGTKYNCTAIVYNELAQGNLYNSVQQPVKLENLYDFAGAMRQLEDQLNVDQLYKLIGTYSIPDSYKIYVDPKIAGYLITPADSNINSARNNNYTVFDGKDATFAAGTSLDKIVDALLSTTKDYQKSLIGANVAGKEGEPAAGTSQMKKFWRIYSESRPLKYDPRRTDYAREFTFYIYEYEIGILEQNSSQTTTTAAEQKSTARRRLATYLNKSILKKRYNYIFTGLNDQIIHFDLEMNCAFAVLKARLGGAFSNSASEDKGLVTQTNSKDAAEVMKKLASTIAFLHNPANSNGSQRDAAIASMKDSISNSGLTSEQKARNIAILNSAKSTDKFTALRDIQNTSGISGGSIDDEVNAAKAQARSLATPIVGAGGNVPTSFISDVDLNSPKIQQAMANFSEYNKNKLRPTVFLEGFQDKAAATGLEANADAGIQKLSSMFSVALHGAYGGSLQSVKMTIKGDPFWMFPYPVTSTTYQSFNSLKPIDEAWAWIKGRQDRQNAQVANQLVTDNFFVLRFRTPRYYDSGNLSDNDATVESDTFSGIYKVTTVVNRFNHGKFEQDIAAILDPELKTSDFRKELDDAAKLLDVPSQPSDLLNTIVPPTAIKTDKIMGSNTITDKVLNQTKEKIPGINSTITSVTAGLNGAVNNVRETVVGGATTIRTQLNNATSNIPSSLPTLPGLPPIFG